jgi:hypothetical protein
MQITEEVLLAIDIKDPVNAKVIKFIPSSEPYVVHPYPSCNG